MLGCDVLSEVNSNPFVFEELAESLSNLTRYMSISSDMGTPYDEFARIYNRAMQQVPTYREVTEITGQTLAAGDRRAGQGAWLLQYVEGLRVYGVHSKVWHRVGDEYSLPLLNQVGTALGKTPKLEADDLQMLGKDDSSLLDVLGIKGQTIWLVQTIWQENLVDSAFVQYKRPAPRLFRDAVFENAVLKGRPLTAMYTVYDVMRKAFPDVDVYAFTLVQHPSLPDFELYEMRIPIGRKRQATFHLNGNVQRSSLDHQEELADDAEALLKLQQRLNDDLFRGLPPCRGGRTLSMLASAAKRQIGDAALICWRERDFAEMMKQDFGYDLPRDKVRHDLCDRLVGQGFFRKRGGEYHLAVRGLARYHYCLAKYTTVGLNNPWDILEQCRQHGAKVSVTYGCL